MELFVISFLLISYAAHGVLGIKDETSALLEGVSASQNIQRRHLLSSITIGGNNAADGSLNLKNTAAYRIQRDWLPEEDVPHPELYYQDLDTGERQLIWAFDDTLPRDVLAGRPDFWLHSIFQIERDVDLLLPFLEHYSRMGIDFKRMIFTLIASNLHSKELLDVQKRLRHIGTVFSTLLFKIDFTSEFCTSKRYRNAVFEANLRATYRVPIKDWIIAVEGNEFIQFRLPFSSGSLTGDGGGGESSKNADGIETRENLNVSTEDFFETLELQGINWVAGLPIERLSSSRSFEKISDVDSLGLQFPLKCQFSSTFPTENRMKIVAYRGYLRPDMNRRSIIPAEKAKLYFTDALFEGKNDVGSGGGGGSTGSNDDYLYRLTPYSRYWKFYKTLLMVGNVYLWSERGADESKVVDIHRFRWKSRAFSDDRVVLACDDDLEERDAMVFYRLFKAGKVDVRGEDGVQCEKEEESDLGSNRLQKVTDREQRLPLRKDAALELAALKSLY
jgi:hypothetical protein